MGNSGMGVNLYMCEDRGTVCSVCEVDIHEPINLRIVQYKYDMSYTSLRFFSYVLSILNVPSYLLSRCTGNAVEVNDGLLAHVEPDRLLLQSVSQLIPS